MEAPKGKLVPIGGHESKDPENDDFNSRTQNPEFFESGILKEVLDELKGPNSQIEIIPAASKTSREMAEPYKEAFHKLGCTNSHILEIASEEDADNEENLRRIAEADGVIFTGGGQNRLFEKLVHTRLAALLKQRYMEEDFLIAGTSAGAMIMSKVMITEGESSAGLVKGVVETKPGLSLLPEGIFDTHFLKRGRLARLAEALLTFPGCVTFGISEDTGMVITEGNRMKAIGSGVIVILEGDHITNTNYKEVEEPHPIYMENVRVHFLAKGASYLFKERKIVRN